MFFFNGYQKMATQKVKKWESSDKPVFEDLDIFLSWPQTEIRRKRSAAVESVALI